MILVDTSVWVDHLRAGDPVLGHLLNSREVLGHRFVTGNSLSVICANVTWC